MGKQAKMKQQNKQSKSLKKEQDKLKYQEEKKKAQDLFECLKSFTDISPSTTTLTRIPKYEEQVKIIENHQSDGMRLDKMCSVCKCKNKKLRICKNCNFEKYCSRECQLKDWDKHKILCKEMKMTAREKSDFNKKTDYKNIRIVSAINLHLLLSKDGQLIARTGLELYKYYEFQGEDEEVPAYHIKMSNNIMDMDWAKGKGEEWIEWHNKQDKTKFVGINGLVYGIDTK